MGKKLTTEEFIKKSKEIHGDKYDYSNVEYVNNVTKVSIICPIHGSFEQKPIQHLSGHGCTKCGRIKIRKKVFGVGIYDIEGEYKFHKKAVNCWRGMLSRCYYEKNFKTHCTYKGCSVCEEWKIFSNFEKWFNENYKNGFCLDKDILHKGNKIYSPNNCCFVPNEINCLFTKRQNKRGHLPIGVLNVSRSNRYQSNVDEGEIRVYLGTFNTPEEAFYAYKIEKEKYIKKIADKWKNEISKDIYNAMYKYNVEITD